jgi:hypothetical protein
VGEKWQKKTNTPALKVASYQRDPQNEDPAQHHIHCIMLFFLEEM